MRAGKLRHPITIVNPTRVTNETGGASIADVTVAQLYASVEWTSGSERSSGGQMESRLAGTFTARFHPDVAANHELLYRERRLRIRAVKNLDERDREMKIECEELGAGVD